MVSLLIIPKMPALVLWGLVLFCQGGADSLATEVKGKEYHGYLFPYPMVYYFGQRNIPEQYWFVPNKDEIAQAECILKAQLPELNRIEADRDPSLTKVHKQVRKYERQYFGLVGYGERKGHKVIWINAIWRGAHKEDLNRKPITVIDGGEFYWSIYIDLTTGKAYDLRVNGIG